VDYSGCRPLGCQNPASLSALTNNLKIIILTWDKKGCPVAVDGG